MRWALALPLVLASCGSPTEPTDLDHPNATELRRLDQCFADHLGLGPVRTLFMDEPRQGVCHGEPCVSVGWAWPGDDRVFWWVGWVIRDHAPGVLARTSAHEVCHLSGIWNESDAWNCADLIRTVAECG